MRKRNKQYRPQVPKFKKVFKGSDETFRAMWDAQGWLHEHGFHMGRQTIRHIAPYRKANTRCRRNCIISMPKIRHCLQA